MIDFMSLAGSDPVPKRRRARKPNVAYCPALWIFRISNLFLIAAVMDADAKYGNHPFLEALKEQTCG
jgi:hypothetical protein